MDNSNDAFFLTGLNLQNRDIDEQPTEQNLD